MTAIVQSIYYNQAPYTLRREIAIMLHQVWPNACPMPGATIPEAHYKELNARSFYSSIDGKLVSYAGVVRKTIKHDGQIFNIAGLSCVATDPVYHGQGLGLCTVSAATQWIEKQGNIDFGIFTCKPSLSSFYNRAGAWSVVQDVVLIGSRDEGALSSESLDVVVLMRLFSEKSKGYESILRHTTINLDFPVGQFL
ncbi:acetyltransferase [Lysinibacillus sphaericus]|uniref:GNAT family N-acetyltransferase n=1 Tax=Lysinibacillus sphaericus TaxID=1421 RepID=UPI0018CCA1F0|nr:GNAT family N-acetyltransferase [Lysinibacillus sphaericus]MBG9455910.1 acetyltransferase [Lysinibacillus sphaericus]MBG9479675.1 acetyltransferase [Lysinibacillus sphaericus]MBG9593459.1 acetyltransferase [Lysinibacillus sphaericus]